MRVIDWSPIYKKYKGKWVALMDDEETVVASGKSLEETAEKAEKKGFRDPIYMNIPSKFLPFVG